MMDSDVISPSRARAAIRDILANEIENMAHGYAGHEHVVLTKVIDHIRTLPLVGTPRTIKIMAINGAERLRLSELDYYGHCLDAAIARLFKVSVQ